MEWWQVLLLFCVGLLSGWMNTLAGGGSLLSVPMLMFLGMSGPVANGTNRIAILAQSIASVSIFLRRGYSDLRTGLTLALAASVGAAGGAALGTRFDGVWFDRTLALVMLLVMLSMLREPPPKVAGQAADSLANPTPRNCLLGHLCMIGAGFWGGLIQAGVGFLLMPILHRIMGLPLLQVNMHKVFIVLVYTSVALLVFASQLELMWWASLGLVAGNTLGGWLGAHTALRWSDLWVRRVFHAILALFILKLLWP